MIASPATVAPTTGHAVLSACTDSMVAFMATVLKVPRFEAELATAQLWDRWVRAFQERHPGDAADAALSAAILYLRDQPPGTPPGPLADSGWHVMLEHDTRCYMALCDALCGGYRHHVPNDVVGVNKEAGKCNSTNDGGGSSKCVCS